MKTIQSALTTIRAQVDRRDWLGAAGLAMLLYGGEQLAHGAGFSAAGAVLVAVAVMVR